MPWLRARENKKPDNSLYAKTGLQIFARLKKQKKKKMESYKERRERKEKQISDFVKEHDSAPKQRTNEWFLMRKKVIGASELVALVGMSPYDNFESIRRKKRSEGVSAYSNPAC